MQARHFWVIVHKTLGDVGYVQFAIWEPSIVIHEVAVVAGHSLGGVITVWLLDEPWTALDRDGAAALDAAIVRHRERGGMVVVALHGGPYPEAADVLDLARHAVARAC